MPERNSYTSVMATAVASSLAVAVTAVGIVALIFGTLLVERHRDHGLGAKSLKFGSEVAQIVFELGSPVVGPKTGTTNSPIKVRGGAMTFRTKKKWEPMTGPGGVLTAFCSKNTDTSLVDFHNISETTSTGGIENVSELSLDTSSSGWTLSFVGRVTSTDASKSGTKPSLNGFTLTSYASKDCTGSPGSGNSVLLQTNSASSDYYPDAAGIEEEDKPSPGTTPIPHAKRFRDKTPSSSTTPGCIYSAGNPSADADICERMSQVTLKTTDSTGAPVENVYGCPNGECSVGIGAPN